MLRFSDKREALQMTSGLERVLDVGSGDMPFPHATVLLDHGPRSSAHPAHRAENPSGQLVYQQKPFVIGELENLPFAGDAFEFVFCSHVLEHVEDPGRALHELQRIAPQGYIECPRSWFEMIDASPFHLWMIDYRREVLTFRRKSREEIDFSLSRRLFDHNVATFVRLYGGVFEQEAETLDTSFEKQMCHICLYWRRPIAFCVEPD